MQSRRSFLFALAGIPAGTTLAATSTTPVTIEPTRPEAPEPESWIEWARSLASMEYNGIQDERPDDWQDQHYSGKVRFSPEVALYYGFGPVGGAQCDLMTVLLNVDPKTLLGGALHHTGRTWCVFFWERGAR